MWWQVLWIVNFSRDKSEKAQHEIPPGEHSYSFPRDSYSPFSEFEVYVTAVNVFGNATSAHLELIPMETGKRAISLILKVFTLHFSSLDWNVGVNITFCQVVWQQYGGHCPDANKPNSVMTTHGIVVWLNMAMLMYLILAD